MTKSQLIQAQLEALLIIDAENTFWTVEECAKELKINKRTVINRIKSNDKHNKIYAEYVGGWRIPKIQFYGGFIDNIRSTSLKAS